MAGQGEKVAAIYVLMAVAGAGALAVAVLGGVIDAVPVRVGLYVLYCAWSGPICSVCSCCASLA